MQKLIIAIAILLIGLTFGNCYYDKFNELHPLDGYVNSCDTTLADTYTGSIDLIMRSNCTSCHNSSIHNGDIYLETYNQVKEQAVNGKLMGSILHESGYQAMPPGTAIRDCEIQRLQDWINADVPQ